MKRFYHYLIIITLSCFTFSCKEKVNEPPPPDDNQYINQGWEAFGKREYQTALDKFTEALRMDSSIADAYNGAGWSSGKLNLLDNAVKYFLSGKSKPNSSLDISAGLSIIYNAKKEYNLSISEAFVIFRTNPEWVFSRDTSVNKFDLRIILAENYFALGNFEISYEHVKLLNPTFNINFRTMEGQTVLAHEIERLRNIF
ncbi:MAG: hypothetical protein QME52_10345 [Bacteroidota bacterium]|nr:hypothetical protein [Bacteroidota bacterium]